LNFEKRGLEKKMKGIKITKYGGKKASKKTKDSPEKIQMWGTGI